LRADLVSGIAVALVLIPQSMAYAQLAGLPPYYGLYASFVSPVVAALFLLWQRTWKKSGKIPMYPRKRKFVPCARL